MGADLCRRVRDVWDRSLHNADMCIEQSREQSHSTPDVCPSKAARQVAKLTCRHDTHGLGKPRCSLFVDRITTCCQGPHRLAPQEERIMLTVEAGNADF